MAGPLGGGEPAGVSGLVELGVDDVDDVVDGLAGRVLVQAVDGRAGRQTGEGGLALPVSAVGHRLIGGLPGSEARSDVVGRGELEVVPVPEGDDAAGMVVGVAERVPHGNVLEQPPPEAGGEDLPGAQRVELVGVGDVPALHLVEAEQVQAGDQLPSEGSLAVEAADHEQVPPPASDTYVSTAGTPVRRASSIALAS